MPELLLINPNTTHSMTDKMASAARAVVPQDTKIHTMTAGFGAPSIEGYYDEVFAIPPMLEVIRSHNKTVDGVIIGCFDDTGVEAARCISESPVVGICQAACQLASILAGSFSIVTTLSRSVHALKRRVLDYGFERQCQSVLASDIPVLALEQCEGDAINALYQAIEQALEKDHSEAIVLGCAGMVDLQQSLQQKYQVPVIEGVTAAVSIMQGLARLPLSTSRKNTYAKPLNKTYSGLFSSFSP